MGKADATLTITSRESGLQIIAIAGGLDTYTTMQLESEFASAVSKRSQYALVDLSEVTFLTSRALAMFVVHAQAMQRAGGLLQLAEPTELVLEVFERAGFVEIFPVHRTLDAGIEHMEKLLAGDD